MNKYLDANAVPSMFPWSREDFHGMIDIITRKAFRFVEYERQETEIPAEYLAQVEEARSKLAETLAEWDERIMELFLEDKEVPEELLKKHCAAPH